MAVGLQKAPCVCFRVSSISCYLVCHLPIHKICALCGIFSAIFVLLTENFDDLEIRVPVGSWSFNTSEFLMCHFLLVIKCTRGGHILYRL